MRKLIKLCITKIGLKRYFIFLHVYFRKWYNIFFCKQKSKLALGERNIYCVPYEWITVDRFGAELNVDFESQNTFEMLENKLDFIYSSHVFEHVTDEGIVETFKKLKKNIKQGCVIRVEVPDVVVAIDDFRGERKLYKELAYNLRKDMASRKPAELVYQQDHLGFVCLLSCYKEADDHTPVIIEYDNLVQLCATSDYDTICKTLISLQTNEQLATHGHLNYFHEQRLKTLLEIIGFENIKRCQIGSSFYDFPIEIERGHRGHFSLILEGRYFGNPVSN